MKTMFLNALKDHSLIPVRCCGPLDQSLHAALLSRTDAARYKEALQKVEAKGTMVWLVDFSALSIQHLLIYVLSQRHTVVPITSASA